MLMSLPLFGQVTHVRTTGELSWVQYERAEYVDLETIAGDYVAVAIACDTGDYLKFCGVPEIEQGWQKYKLVCHPPETIGPTTMQACGEVSPFSGEVTLWLPVIQSGIEYEATYVVIEGP